MKPWLENYCRSKVHFTGALYVLLIASAVYLKQ